MVIAENMGTVNDRFIWKGTKQIPQINPWRYEKLFVTLLKISKRKD